MLSEMFWDFQKTLIYKERCEQSKNKERKKLYHKSAMKVFQVCMIIVYDSFFLELSISISAALLLWRERKIRTFKTLVSKNKIWWLKKSHSNDKLLEKITSSSYHMEQKTFIEASCIYNIHTGGKMFCSCCFWRFVSRLDSDS